MASRARNAAAISTSRFTRVTTNGKPPTAATFPKRRWPQLKAPAPAALETGAQLAKEVIDEPAKLTT